MRTVDELEQILAQPSPALVADISELDGDIMILGVGGKMGPSLAKLAKKAIDEAGVRKKVIGVSRFTTSEHKEDLERFGVETIAADLLEDDQLHELPDVANIIYMVGHKFGTTGREYLTWAMNSFLPGRVAHKFRDSRIVSFSSGNVYPITPVKMGGASEEYSPAPLGEYAMSCLGRERVFEYFSHKYSIPLVQFRLNYAIDMRYGVLLEIATSVYNRKPIDVTMGHVNVIWQGDANEMALRSLNVCSSPPNILNITGPEIVSTVWLAERFGELFGIQPIFENEEASDALLSNASRSHQLFGYPHVSLRTMIEWTAEWVEHGGETLNKPTHFQERKGEF